MNITERLHDGQAARQLTLDLLYVKTGIENLWTVNEFGIIT